MNGLRTRQRLHACNQPPESRRYIGPDDSEALHLHAMKLYPSVALAERWLEAIRFLRSRNLWTLDEPRRKS